MVEERPVKSSPGRASRFDSYTQNLMTRDDIVFQLKSGPLPLAKMVGDRSVIAKLLVELLRGGVVTTVGTRDHYMYVLTNAI